MIYRDKPYFKFIYVLEGITYEHYLEEEPVKWDQVNIILKRDPVYHGMNYEFTDSDIQLEFAKDCGLHIIELVYNSDGQDGNIILQFGFIINGVETVEFEGKLNLNTRKKEKERVSCMIENNAFKESINTNNEITIDLFDTKTIEGLPKESNPIEVTLHSKKLQQFTVIKNQSLNGVATGDFDSDATVYLTFDLTNKTTDNIKDCFTTGLSVIDLDPTDPSIDLSLFDLTDGGNFKFDFDLRFKIGYSLIPSSPPPPNLNSWHLQVFCKILRGTEFISHPDEIIFDTGVRTDANYVIEGGYKVGFNYDFAFTKTIESIALESGDKVYVYGSIIPNAARESGISVDMKENYTEGEENRITILKVSALTEQEESQAKAILIHEALDSSIQSMTGAKAFYSDVFGREDIGYSLDGKYHNKVITNGFFIRNFKIEDRKLSITFKKLLDSIRAIFGIGLGFEKDNGSDIVRIEPLEYFYGTNEILSIQDCADFSEETCKENIFNKLTVGYNKYPDEGEYILDEFNTKLEFSTPIKTNKNELPLLSDLVASGFAIEETRRNQFLDTPDDSTSYDEDNFIISVIKSGEVWKSEKTENFTLQNVISADTAYNVSISPKRNLFRFAKWINSGLYFKKDTEQIRNSAFTNNGDAMSQGTDESDFLMEKSDITLSNFDSKLQIFKPTWINFKCRLGFDKIQLIKNAHIEKNHPLKNGYVSVKDPDGVWRHGYIFELTFNPSKEEVNIKMLEASRSAFGTCSDYADYTFEMFESEIIPSWIEDCKFANFN